MNPGKLRHKIIIEQATESQNSYGEVINTWATFTTRRASISNLRGGESLKSNQVSSEASILFVLRTLSGVTTKMRVSYDSRLFDIVYVDNGNETQKETRLECTEQT